MLSEPTLRALLAERGLDAPVRFEERTRSTQALARTMADGGAPEWTLVCAGHQTEGRGRLGRTWLDEEGSALLVSIVLRPSRDVDLGLVPLLAGAAAAEAAAASAGSDVTCRWPNDLFIDDRKVGGILAESWSDADGATRTVVLGMGINLRAAPTAAVPRSAPLGDVDAAALLGAFLDRFVGPYRDGVRSDEVLARYVPRCATLGRRVRARHADGALVLDVGGRIVRITSGEVVGVREDAWPDDPR